MVTVIYLELGRATVVANPICRQKTQTSHVSNDSDHFDIEMGK